MKYVIVPQDNIDAIEDARVRLVDIIDNIKDEDLRNHLDTLLAFSVIYPMWLMTHRKYRETFRSKIHSVLARFFKGE